MTPTGLGSLSPALSVIYTLVGAGQGIFSAVNQFYFKRYAEHFKTSAAPTVTSACAALESISRLKMALQCGFKMPSQFTMGKCATPEVLAQYQGDINWATCAGACVTGLLSRFLFVYRNLDSREPSIEELTPIVRCAIFSANLELVQKVFTLFIVTPTSPCMHAAICIAGDLQLQQIFEFLWFDLKGGSMDRLHCVVNLSLKMLKRAMENLEPSRIDDLALMHIATALGCLGSVEMASYWLGLQDVHDGIWKFRTHMLVQAITHDHKDMIAFLVVDRDVEWCTVPVMCSNNTFEYIKSLGFTGLHIGDCTERMSKRDRIASTLQPFTMFL